ncbi:MAG: hypothetical protein IIW92_04345 [Lachnospiraceae bacterium]|nr:hypothetical protein [Lachnospiraceae bacterium]
MANINNPHGNNETFRTELNNQNGAIPVIFEKKLALVLGATGQAVTDNLTNRNFEGEISKQGDKVRIVIPDKPDRSLVQSTSAKGGLGVCPVFHSFAPEALDLVINKVQTFAVAIDDVQKAQTQFKGWLDAQANAYGQAMKEAKDIELIDEVFTYNPSASATTDPEYTPSNHPLAGEYGTLAAPFSQANGGYDVNSQNIFTFLLKIKEDLIMSGAIGADGTYSYSPLSEETRDERAVILVTPAMHTLIMSSYRVGGRSVEMADVVVKDGRVERVAGLDIVVTKNLVEYAKDENAPTVMPFIAGTRNAITIAEQLNKVEGSRDPFCFRDLMKVINLYGIKVVHPECIVRGALPATNPTEAVPTKTVS